MGWRTRNMSQFYYYFGKWWFYFGRVFLHHFEYIYVNKIPQMTWKFLICLVGGASLHWTHSSISWWNTFVHGQHRCSEIENSAPRIQTSISALLSSGHVWFLMTEAVHLVEMSPQVPWKALGQQELPCVEE